MANHFIIKELDGGYISYDKDRKCPSTDRIASLPK